MNYKNLLLPLFVKKYDLHVLLGVANFTALPDTLQWYNETASNIATLEPWGISCDYTMFPSLSDSFPDKKIHFWNTPQAITPSVEQKTIDMENTPNVKVVLVDYTIIK